MASVTVGLVVFVLAITCLVSSLPIGEETKESSTLTPASPTVNLKTDGEKEVSKEDVQKEAVVPLSENEASETVKESNNGPVEISETFVPVTTNGSQDVYVIKTIVYEVGILTDANDSTLNDTESHEEINLTFFDPKRNESTIDLSNIPVPIQTNVSGVSITGLAPANFGIIQLSEGDKPATLTPSFPLTVPLLPNAVISVKHNISTTNAEKEAELLNTLPNLLGLTSPITGETLKVEAPTNIKTEEDKNASDQKEGSKESTSKEQSSEESREDSKESTEKDRS